MVIAKSYFTRGSRLTLASTLVRVLCSKSQRLPLKAIITKSSILDISGAPDRHLITIFGKVVLNLMQATVISFSLIAINGKGYLYGNHEIIFY